MSNLDFVMAEVDVPATPRTETYPYEQRVPGLPWTVASGRDPAVVDALHEAARDPACVMDVWITGGLLLQDPRGEPSASPMYAARDAQLLDPLFAVTIWSEPGSALHFIHLLLVESGFPLSEQVPSTAGELETMEESPIHAANRDRILAWLKAFPGPLDFASSPRWTMEPFSWANDAERYHLQWFKERLSDTQGPITRARGGWRNVFVRVEKVDHIDAILGPATDRPTVQRLLAALEMLARTKSAHLDVGPIDWEIDVEGKQVRAWNYGAFADGSTYQEHRAPLRALYVQAIEAARRAGLPVEDADDQIERLWYALQRIERGEAEA
jgi:hypothetical protein